MTDNTILLPQTSDQGLLARYYSLADTFVICSKRENFPTTCLEAQCCGTPVAGFDVGGIKETSIGGTMNFVPFGDLDGLRASVGRAMEEDGELTASEARRLFSKETMIENYLREYDRGGRKERILLIDVNCKHSSTGKIVYDLFQGIKKNGRDARICYGRGENINEKGIYKFGLDWETNIHAGLARVTGYNGYFSPISTYRLIHSIEEYKPDLIHIHELHAYFVNIKPLIEYIKKKKIPVVYTFHCEYTYTGKCGYANECSNFMNECGNCPELHEYPKSLLFDRTRQMLKMKKQEFGNLDMTIVAPSKWLADRVKLSFLKNKQIDVIYNGIDTNVFHPVDASDLRVELKIPADHKIILSVAPDIMSERKGGKWVLKLAEMIKKDKVTFILVGVKNICDINILAN